MCFVTFYSGRITLKEGRGDGGSEGRAEGSWLARQLSLEFWPGLSLLARKAYFICPLTCDHDTSLEAEPASLYSYVPVLETQQKP